MDSTPSNGRRFAGDDDSTSSDASHLRDDAADARPGDADPTESPSLDSDAPNTGSTERDAGETDDDGLEADGADGDSSDSNEEVENADATIPGETMDPEVLADIDIDPRLLKAAEAMIFAADEPVPPHRIAEIFADVTGRMQPDLATIEAHVRALNQEYQSSGRPLVVHEWSGGYRMTTRSEMSPFVKALVVGEQETSLSRSLLETLAVLAYRQPVTRPEVDFVRGVNSDYAIRKLLDLGLADVKGRSESLGRPLLYGTTDRFLEQFGLNTLEDLPTLREIEDLLDDANFDEERSQLLQLNTEKEITDRETAKEVLSEAREMVQKGELDAQDFMDADAPGENQDGTDETDSSEEKPQVGAASDHSTSAESGTDAAATEESSMSDGESDDTDASDRDHGEEPEKDGA